MGVPWGGGLAPIMEGALIRLQLMRLQCCLQCLLVRSELVVHPPTPLSNAQHARTCDPANAQAAVVRRQMARWTVQSPAWSQRATPAR